MREVAITTSSDSSLDVSASRPVITALHPAPSISEYRLPYTSQLSCTIVASGREWTKAVRDLVLGRMLVSQHEADADNQSGPSTFLPSLASSLSRFLQAPEATLVQAASGKGSVRADRRVQPSPDFEFRCRCRTSLSSGCRGG